MDYYINLQALNIMENSNTLGTMVIGVMGSKTYYFL